MVLLTILSPGATAFALSQGAGADPPEETRRDPSDRGNVDYIRPDGTVDVSAMPETEPVLDASGNTVGYAKTAELFADPPWNPEKGPPTQAEVRAPVRVFDYETHKQVGLLDAEGFQPTGR